MNGAESLVRTLVGGGVNVCFANPGTSEMHLVAALDRVEGMRCVLGLFEGVVTGAADGYARMTGNPAATSCIRTSSTASWPAQIVARHPACVAGTRKPCRGISCAQHAHSNSSSSAFAFLRSRVAKPSVNQP